MYNMLFSFEILEDCFVAISIFSYFSSATLILGMKISWLFAMLSTRRNARVPTLVFGETLFS